jgi:transcriptional regulator with PAS, ATPase and Fis domain
MENELFGHEKGSFTSAEVAVEGLVDVANGGTLFLDEIGEMPLAIQVKMLRLLQEREYRRVGGTRILHADVRIVAATNRDLKDWVKQGRFREDLFYRLNVAAIRTPSLSQMREDIALITNRLLVKLRDAKPVAGISEEALKVLMAYHWPGNVRQLQNALECAALMCERGKIVQPEHLPSYVWETETPEIPTGGYYESMHQHQMKIVQNALIQTAGAYPEAARLLGISERYLRTLAHTHKLDT